jgi:hypothetical protein
MEQSMIVIHKKIKTHFVILPAGSEVNRIGTYKKLVSGISAFVEYDKRSFNIFHGRIK